MESRQRVGDWEGDTIVGKGLARVVILVERKSGLLRIRRVANGEANTVLHAVVHALHPVRVRVHTLTWDNGSEFAEHALIDIALKAKSTFAAPYSSWQRGGNENTNGQHDRAGRKALIHPACAGPARASQSRRGSIGA